MAIIRVESIIKEINERVDGETLARLLDYHPNKIQIAPNSIKCFCPLHKEQAFRSLLIEQKTKTYRCTMKKCIGFEGGSLVDLWALHRGLETLDAALDLAEHLKLDIDVASLRTLGSEMLKKAMVALETGEMVEARQSIEQAIAFLPQSAEAIQLSAEIYSASGELDKAREEFLRLADLHIETKAFEEARTLLAPIAEANSNDLDVNLRVLNLARAENDRPAAGEALIRIASILTGRNENKKAAEALREAVQCAEDNTTLLEKAAVLFEKAALTSDLIDVLGRLSKLYESAEKWQELYRVLERRRIHDAENAELQEKIAGALLRIGNPEEAAERYLELAGLHKDVGDLDKACDLLRQLLASNPERIDIEERLADWLIEAGKNAEAIEHYRKLAAEARKANDAEGAARYLSTAKRIEPDDLGLRRDLAEIQLEQNNVNEAIAEFFELANIHLNESDPSQGFAILDRIAELASEDTPRLIEIGHCLEAAGYDDRALNFYLGVIERMLGADQHSLALPLFEEAQRIAPRDQKLLDLRIDAHLALDQKAEAIEACRKMAKAFSSLGEHEPAERLLQRAIKIDRADSGAKTDLAQLYEAMGRQDEAAVLWIETAVFHKASEDHERVLQAAREALRLNPENVEAKRLVADCLESRGQAGEALDLWRESADAMLESDPNSSEALDLIERCLKIAPRDLGLLSKAAILKYRITGPEKALPAFSEWLERTEKEGSSLDAIEAFRTAVQSYPKERTWRMRLAQLLAEHGEPREAVPHLELLLADYIQSNERGPAYRQVLEKLVKLCPEQLDLRVEWAEALAQAEELERAGSIFSDVAKQYLSRGDQENGLRVLQLSLRYQPNDRDLLGRVAELLERSGKAAEAVKAYDRLVVLNREADSRGSNIPVLQKLLALAPDRDDLRMELGDTYEARGDLDNAAEQFYRVAQGKAKAKPAGEEALKLCQKLAQMVPEFIAGREALVDCYLARKEIDKAKAELDSMGDLALRDGDLAQAESIFKRIQEIDPKDIGSGERLGKLYEARGQMDKAAGAYQTVLDLYKKAKNGERVVAVLQKLKSIAPADLSVRRELARTLTKQPDSANEAAEEWFELITTAVGQGNLKDAESARKEAAPLLVSDWPRRFRIVQVFAEALGEEKCVAAWGDLAREAIEANELQVAFDAASEGLCLAPDDADVRELRIEASRRSENWDAAEADLRLLAEMKTAAEQHAAAERYLARAIEIKPESDELIAMLAQSQIAQAHHEEAVQTLRHLTECYRGRGDYDLAVATAQQIAELIPGNIDNKDYLAAILLDGNRVEEAMELWREAGNTLVTQGKADLALVRFESILGHLDRDIDALRKTADLTLQTQGPEAAHERFERLLSVVVEDASVEEAEAEFRRVLSAQPQNLAISERYAIFLHDSGHIDESSVELLRIVRVWRDERNDPAQALRLLEKLRDLDPGNLSAVSEEATLYEKTGNIEKASAVLIELANLHRERGEAEPAAEAMARRAGLLTDNVEAQVESGEAYEELGHIENATKLYLRAIEIYDGRGEIEPCIPLLKRAIALNPEQLHLTEALAQAYERSAKTELAVQQWLEAGANYESSEDAARAAKIYRHVKELAPEAMEARRRLVRMAEASGDTAACLAELRDMAPVAAQKGDPQETIELLRHIRRHDPEDTQSLVALADQFRNLDRTDELFETLSELEQHHRDRNRIEEAIIALDEMKALRPGESELAERSFELVLQAGQNGKAAKIGIDLVRNYLERRDNEHAEVVMRRVVEIEPENVDRRISMAQLANSQCYPDIARRQFEAGFETLVQMKAADAALALAEAGIEMFADDTQLRGHHIQALKLAKRNDEAIEAQLKLASLHERQGNAAAALETIDAILAEYPDHQKANEQAALLAMEQGDNARAGDHLLRLAESHYVAGRLADSIHSLEEMLKLVPQQTALRCRLAEMHHEAGDASRARQVWMQAAEEFRATGSMEQAIEVYERIRSIDPEDLGTLARLTECYRESGDEKQYLAHANDLGRAQMKSGAIGDAIATFEALAETSPKNSEAWEQLAACYREAGEDLGAVRCLKSLYELHQSARRLDRAKSCLEQALQIIENDADMLQMLGDVCLRLNQKPEGLRHMTTAAMKLSESGRGAEARVIIEKILKIDPANLETRRLLGSVCEAAGDTAEAVKQYGLAARGWLEKRNHALAIEIFEHLLNLDETQIDEREAYARALEREGRISDACDQYLRLIELLPEDVDARQTIRYCRQILKEAPDHVQAHEHLCRVYERTGKPRLALKECEWIADYCMKNGESDRAEEYLRRGLEQCPEEVDIRKTLIELLIAAGRSAEAADCLNEVARLAQARADIPTARWAVAKACEVDPSNIEHRQRLAEQQEQAGEFDEARKTRLAIMRLLLESGEMEEARRAGERLADSAPEDETLRKQIADIFEEAGLPEVAAFHYSVMAKSALSAGRHERARELADHILSIKPRHLQARECMFEALGGLGEIAKACEQAQILYEYYAESNDLESAQRSLKFIIQHQPSNPEPRKILAELFRRMNRPEAMVEQIRKLAEIYATSGDIDRAINALKDVIREKPDDTRARARYIDLYSQIGDEGDLYEDYVVLANMLRKNGAVIEATQVYEKLILRHPEQPECREMFVEFLFEQGQISRGVLESRALTELYIKNGMKAEAGRALDRAVAKAPDDIELRHQLATLQISTNRRGLALETLRELLRQYDHTNNELRQIDVLKQMLEIDELNVDNRQRLAGLMVKHGQNEDAREQRMKLAETYLGRELYDLAEREYRRILDLYPGDTEVWQRVIETHLHIGTPTEVVPDMVVLANLYAHSGRLKDAVGTYKQILDIEKDNVEVLQRYIEAYLQIGLEQDLVDEYLRLADLQSRMGNADEALNLYKHLREIAPDNETVEERLRENGIITTPPQPKEVKAGPQEQIAKFVQSEEPSHETPNEQNLRAIRNYENILKLNPENPMVRAKLAELIQQTGNKAQADEHWLRAANDFLNRGDLERAIEIYTELAERRPDDAEIKKQMQKAMLKRDSLNVIEDALEEQPKAEKAPKEKSRRRR